jgi:hypothetical protein
MCSTSTETATPTKLIRLIRMCLNEMCSRIRVVKHMFDACGIQCGLNK